MGGNFFLKSCRKRERKKDQCENILGTKTAERGLDFKNPKWKREIEEKNFGSEREREK